MDFTRWFAVIGPAALTLTGLTVAAPASAAPCPDVEVVFARGTFEPPGVGPVGQSFVDALRARTAGRSVEVYPVIYPASIDFKTAADGVIDASNRVRTTAANCPDTDIVVGGFSQGAAVAAYITADRMPDGYTPPPGMTGPMEPSVADHVAAVALFGKPSSGFLQRIYTGAPEINVGPNYVAKTLDLCIDTDPICSPSGGDGGAHGAYAAAGMTDQAADFVVSKLRQPAEPVDQASG
jgi:cutinase